MLSLLQTKMESPRDLKTKSRYSQIARFALILVLVVSPISKAGYSVRADLNFEASQQANANGKSEKNSATSSGRIPASVQPVPSSSPGQKSRVVKPPIRGNNFPQDEKR